LAYRRALARIPQAEIEEFRKLQTERCEAMILALQGGISKGNPRPIEVGVQVLQHEAKLNNLVPPANVNLTSNGETVHGIDVIALKQYLAMYPPEEPRKAIETTAEEVKQDE